MVHQFVYQRLWMLNAHTQSKTFRFQPDTFVQEHAIGVMGGVPDSKDGGNG